MTPIERATAEAIKAGWTPIQTGEKFAVFRSGAPPGAPVTNSFHIINGLITLLTGGLWLPGWMALWVLFAIGTARSFEATLIAKEVAGEITYEHTEHRGRA